MRGSLIQTVVWIDHTSGFWDDNFAHRNASETDRLGLEQLAALLNTAALVKGSRTPLASKEGLLRMISHGIQLDPNFNTSERWNVIDSSVENFTSVSDRSYGQEIQSHLPILDSDIAALYRGEDVERDNKWYILNGLTEAARGRRIFKTETGCLGLASKAVQPGDKVAILHGSGTPGVLRSSKERNFGNGDYYEFMGCCYLEGTMFGEATTWAEKDADVLRLV